MSRHHPSTGRAIRVATAGIALLALAGCGRRPGDASRGPGPDSLASAAEPAPALTLPAGELPASAPAPPPSMVAVAPRRAELSAPLPDAPPAEVPPAPDTPAEPDDALKPPIPRHAAVVAWPARTPASTVVELDVRVDEQGEPSDALWAAGDTDSARVAAAIEAALAQRFWPALQRGRAVAVWCRQRFARSAERAAGSPR